MKIAVPTTDDGGLQATIASHFGQAAYFTIIDSESGEVSPQPNTGEHHGGAVTPAQLIAEAGTNMVLCGGLGSRAVALFAQAGIDVYVGAQGTVQDALDAHRDGRLGVAAKDGACPDGESCH